MLRLRFTTGSPFARAVRIVLHEKGLDYEPVEEITTTSAQERAKDAPTLQVPAFRDGNLRLWDSGVIIDHLMERYPNAPRRAEVPPFANRLLEPDRELAGKLQLATLQSLGVSMATVSQMKWSGVGLENEYAARNAERVQYLLEWFEGELTSEAEGFAGGVASVQDVLLAVWIMFAEKRPIGIEWRAAQRPKIAALHMRMAARPSFVANPIWHWEPGVTGYETDGTPIYGG